MGVRHFHGEKEESLKTETNKGLGENVLGESLGVKVVAGAVDGAQETGEMNLLLFQLIWPSGCE